MKWYSYLICILLVICGTFCGLQFYREVKAESYVNGSIDITNKFSQKAFSFSSTSIKFYEDFYDDNKSYKFEKDLIKVDNFDGQKNKYEVLFNDYYILNCTFEMGSVYFKSEFEFYDVDGSTKQTADLQVSIVFLSNKTQLKVSTDNEDSARFLEQYFADYGFKINVNEIR